MNNLTKITHNILINSGYRKLVFHFTRYVKDVEDERYAYHISFYPSDNGNYSIAINKYQLGFIGLFGNCTLNCIKDCQKANKIIELFTDGLGLLVIPEEQ